MCPTHEIAPGEDERATLRKLGASLQPLRPEELGPIAGLGAAHGELVAKSLSVTNAASCRGEPLVHDAEHRAGPRRGRRLAHRMAVVGRTA